VVFDSSTRRELRCENDSLVTQRKTEQRAVSGAAGLVLAALLSACGGGGESPDAPADEPTVDTSASESPSTDDDGDEERDERDENEDEDDENDD
jgi:hypothetical protein